MIHRVDSPQRGSAGLVRVWRVCYYTCRSRRATPPLRGNFGMPPPAADADDGPASAPPPPSPSGQLIPRWTYGLCILVDDDWRVGKLKKKRKKTKTEPRRSSSSCGEWVTAAKMNHVINCWRARKSSFTLNFSTERSSGLGKGALSSRPRPAGETRGFPAASEVRSERRKESERCAFSCVARRRRIMARIMGWISVRRRRQRPTPPRTSASALCSSYMYSR